MIHQVMDNAVNRDHAFRPARFVHNRQVAVATLRHHADRIAHRRPPKSSPDHSTSLAPASKTARGHQFRVALGENADCCGPSQISTAPVR
jgi:hypothetical protein